MVGVTAASADLRELAADLAFASKQGIDKAAVTVIHDIAQRVQQAAIAAAPRKTGKLAASIHITWVDKLKAEIKPTEIYGVFQEFGTATKGEFPSGMYEIRPKSPGGVLVFQVGGKTVFARVVHHPGVKAQPFMRPALVQALEPFAEQMAAKGQLLITKGPRSAL